MTYDDGIVALYELTETQDPGEEPQETLTEYDRFYFCYDLLGIQRYYTALQAGQQVEAVINVPGWHEIRANHYIAIIAKEGGSIDEDCTQYRIRMVQPMVDTDGLRITKLTLEKVGDKYVDFS